MLFYAIYHIFNLINFIYNLNSTFDFRINFYIVIIQVSCISYLLVSIPQTQNVISFLEILFIFFHLCIFSFWSVIFSDLDLRYKVWEDWRESNSITTYRDITNDKYGELISSFYLKQFLKYINLLVKWKINNKGKIDIIYSYK